MKSYESRVTIDASPEAIWPVLTDAPGFADWDNSVVRIEGSIAPGQKIKIYAEVNPKRAFAAKVVFDEPGRKMTWTGGMPLGLFKGVRTFTLTPSGEGKTEFHMREEYTGPFLPVIWRTMPDLQPSFDQFAAGLKTRAEGGS